MVRATSSAAQTVRMFFLDQLNHANTLTVVGVNDKGERQEVTLKRLTRTSQTEVKEYVAEKTAKGDVTYKERNRFSGDTTPVTVYYFRRNRDAEHDVRVSEFVACGRRFFDGKDWLMVEDFTITAK